MNRLDHDTDRAGGGGFREAFARIFGDADNPLGWGITIGAVAGIRIKLHLLFVIYIIAQVLWSIPRDSFGPGYTMLAMAALFGWLAYGVLQPFHNAVRVFVSMAAGGLFYFQVSRFFRIREFELFVGTLLHRKLP